MRWRGKRSARCRGCGVVKRRAFTVRVPEETHSQIEKLAARLGTKTSVVIIAVRELYRRELGKRPAGREEEQDDGYH